MANCVEDTEGPVEAALTSDGSFALRLIVKYTINRQGCP